MKGGERGGHFTWSRLTQILVLEHPVVVLPSVRDRCVPCVEFAREVCNIWEEQCRVQFLLRGELRVD